MEKIKYFTTVIVVLILISGIASCDQKSHPEVEMEVSSLRDTLAHDLSEDRYIYCEDMQITDLRFDKIKNTQGKEVYAVVISNRLMDEEDLEMCKVAEEFILLDIYVSLNSGYYIQPLIKKCIDEEVDLQIVSYAEGSDLEPIITDISHQSLTNIKEERLKYALKVIWDVFDRAEWLTLDYDDKNMIITYQEEEDSTEDLTQSSEEELKDFATGLLIYFDEKLRSYNFMNYFMESGKDVVFILKNKSGEVEKKIFLNTAETYLRTLKAVEGKFKNADELLAQGQTDEARELRLKAEGYRDAIKFGIEKGTIKVDNFTDNQKNEFSEILDRLYK